MGRRISIDHNRDNNDITNLIVLCGTDHLLVHRGIVKLGELDGLGFTFAR